MIPDASSDAVVPEEGSSNAVVPEEPSSNAVVPDEPTEKPSEPVIPVAHKLGDVNNDGRVSAADARLALRQAVGLENYAADSAEFKAADVDANGKVTAYDARMILRCAVGLEDLNKPVPVEPASEAAVA